MPPLLQPDVNVDVDTEGSFDKIIEWVTANGNIVAAIIVALVVMVSAKALWNSKPGFAIIMVLVGIGLAWIFFQA